MKNILLISLTIFTFLSCEKKYDTPPISYPEAGNPISLESLIALFIGNPIAFEKADSLSLYATVTMDEKDGNLYKSIYVQDGDFAINVRLQSAGGLLVGDSIRIDLEGTRLSTYNGVLQLDSVHVDRNVTKLASNRDITPLTLSLIDVNSNLQSRLIKLVDVQFISPQLDQTYADGSTNESRDITIEDCDGNTMYFRNSGYASFADELIAQGNGSITAIVGIYNGDVQLLIRSFDEIKLNGERCAGQLIVKNFDDGLIETGGWSVKQVVGNDSWVTNDQGASSFYCQISNFNGSNNNPCESWLISPAIDLNSIIDPKFKFLNAANYQGANLEVYISLDYNGIDDPNNATWSQLNSNLSTGAWSWVSSGLVDLSSYASSNARLAFKYNGTASDGKTWEIDDIIIIGSL